MIFSAKELTIQRSCWVLHIVDMLFEYSSTPILVQAMRIENGVYLGPLGALAFEGRFSMKKRILAFLFDKLKIKIGSLPHFTINIGKKEDEGRIPGNTDPFFIWFYADDEIIVAKGRGGGLAFWCRCRRVAKWFYLSIFYKRIILFHRPFGGHGTCIVQQQYEVLTENTTASVLGWMWRSPIPKEHWSNVQKELERFVNVVSLIL